MTLQAKGDTGYIQSNTVLDDQQKAIFEQFRAQVVADLATVATAPMATAQVTTSTTNAATSKFTLFANAVLKSVSAIVTTAGTNVGIGGVGVGSDGYSVVFGTTTAGVLITGSDTAGSIIGPFTLTGTVPAGTVLQVSHGTETHGVFNVTVAYATVAPTLVT